MQLVAPLIQLTMNLCQSIFKKNSQEKTSLVRNTRLCKYYRNQKVLTQMEIQEIKSIIQEGSSKDLIKGKKADQIKKIGQKKLLLLDLDQTVIYAKGLNGIQLRPYAQQLLETIYPYFHIVIFTAASRQYTLSVLRKFRNQLSKISQIICRQNCTAITRQNKGQRIFVKELQIIEDYNINEIVVVDDTPVTYCMNSQNAIGIQPFYGDIEDKEFLKLKDYLIDVKNEIDVRQFFKYKSWKDYEIENNDQHKL